MARIRSIKPEFFSSLTIASLPLTARLTFIGLWTHVDDEGRCVDEARLVKAAVWPLDDRTAADVESDLRVLSESSLILRYRVGERSYLTVLGWGEHQRINRPTKSKLPAPPERVEQAEKPPPAQVNEPPTSANAVVHEASVIPHRVLTEGSLAEGNREQGTGNREVPPSAGRALTLAPAALDVVVPTEPPSTTDALVAEWIDHCAKRPPGPVIGQVGKQIKAMLAEGIDPADVRCGLAEWARKGIHPSALPSVVNEVMNAPSALRRRDSPRRSTTDERVAQGLALADQLDANPNLLQEAR